VITIIQIVGVTEQWWEIRDEDMPLFISLLNRIGTCQRKIPIREPVSDEKEETKKKV